VHAPPSPADGARTPPSRIVLPLLFIYPLLTHLAVHLHSLALTAAAALLLLVLSLRGALAARRPWAWLALAAGVGLLAWTALSGGRHDALFALYAAPVMIYVFLAWFFGRTLRRGSVPLITRMAVHLHAEAVEKRPEMRAYTRRLTEFWTALFLALAAVNLGLAALISPDGIIELLGGRSPWPLPPTLWSLFANFLSFGVVLLFFAIEFLLRSRRFPEAHARYRNVLDFLIHLRGALPVILDDFGPTDPGADTAHAPPRLLLRRSWRRPVLWLVAAAHLAAAALALAGHWPLALATVVASHLLMLWATLVAGSALLGPVVTHFATARREVWLTIDDGPSADTPALLDLLDAHAARATFFLVGARAAAEPALVREIARRGHGIGNHSAQHSAAWFWAASPRVLEREVGGAQAVLAHLGGSAPTQFRCVVGMSNLFVAPALQRHGLLRVAWSARGYDTVNPAPQRVWRRLQRGLRPGAILLLHEGAAHGASAATLQHVLQQLTAQGYRCVLPEPPLQRPATTSQLLNGVPPHSGVNVESSPQSASSDASAARSG